MAVLGVFVILAIVLAIAGWRAHQRDARAAEVAQYHVHALLLYEYLLAGSAGAAAMTDEVSSSWSEATKAKYVSIETGVQIGLDNCEKNGLTAALADASEGAMRMLEILPTPPAELQETHDLLMELNREFVMLHSQATNPTGSLSEYGSSTRASILTIQGLKPRLMVLLVPPTPDR